MCLLALPYKLVNKLIACIDQFLINDHKIMNFGMIF